MNASPRQRTGGRERAHDDRNRLCRESTRLPNARRTSKFGRRVRTPNAKQTTRQYRLRNGPPLESRPCRRWLVRLRSRQEPFLPRADGWRWQGQPEDSGKRPGDPPAARGAIRMDRARRQANTALTRLPSNTCSGLVRVSYRIPNTCPLRKSVQGDFSLICGWGPRRASSPAK